MFIDKQHTSKQKLCVHADVRVCVRARVCVRVVLNSSWFGVLLLSQSGSLGLLQFSVRPARFGSSSWMMTLTD